MANALYDCYKQDAVGDSAGPGHGPINWDVPGGTGIKAALMDNADYTVNAATHQDQVDLTDAGIVATSGVIVCTASIAAGTITVDAADWVWTAVTGDQSESVVVYWDSGTDSTSLLAIYFDTFSAGMPVLPNGGDINVTVNASGLFTW